MESQPPSPAGAEPPAKPTVSKEIFNLWAKYEDVAMHFNDLIMRWRLQAIGGVAALVTLAGFVVGDQPDLEVRYRGMLIFAGTFASAWVGVALIDVLYLRRLLSGAVAALLELEAKLPDVTLSTKIEEHAKRWTGFSAWLFYGCGLVPLLAIAGYAVWNLCRLP